MKMIDTLTSLRLFFALLVFVSHLEIISSGFSKHIFLEGYVGVSFFFILSGFIIAHNYSQRVGSHEQKRDYFIARFARIYPLHLLTLLAAIALYGFAASNPISWAKLATSATLTNAYVPHPSFFFALNAPAWSLCCEQLFYATFPFILPFVRERKQLVAFIALAIIIVVIGAQITPENYVKGIWYVNPITRYPDFVIGIASLKAYQKIKNYNIAPQVGTIMEIASIALFLLFYLGAEGVPRIYRYSFYYWAPIALVIIVFALQKGALSRLLTNKFLLLGGEISYGIYLTHLLILNTTNKHCTEASTGCKIVIVLVATVVLSYLSYRFYEKPANAAIKKWLKFKNKRG